MRSVLLRVLALLCLAIGLVALLTVNPAGIDHAVLQRAVRDLSVCDCGFRLCRLAGEE